MALCHDWILDSRGAERLLVEFGSGWPDCDIWTLLLDSATLDPRLRQRSIYASALNRLPGVRGYYRYTLPLFRRALRNFVIGDADLVFSISHSVAKAFPRRPGIPHVCYCLTPMRYLWAPELYGRGLRRSLQELALSVWEESLKEWDLETSRSVNYFVAISETVRKRIGDVYDRESEVIYPCIDLDFYTPSDLEREDFFLTVSGLVPQKRLDIAVKAFSRTGARLVVVGTGPLKGSLQRTAGDNVQFLGWQSDEVIRDLYRRARALVFPGLEDFGLVPVEALACACPVIAYGRGGATEVVQDGVTGVLYKEQGVEGLLEALTTFNSLRVDSLALRESAERFSRDRFRQSWRDFFERVGLESLSPWRV